MLLAFAEPLHNRTTACTEIIYRLQHYSQLVAAYITQSISSLTVSINRLSRAHSDGASCQDLKEPWYIIAKNKKTKKQKKIKKYNVGLHDECFELYHCK